jgi:hypothetical protein
MRGVKTDLVNFCIRRNVNVPEIGQYRRSDRISASLIRFRSTTRYDNTITLALIYTLLDIFFFLVLDFGSNSSRYSPLF